jgi:hypothetical protein
MTPAHCAGNDAALSAHEFGAAGAHGLQAANIATTGRVIHHL